MVVSPCYWIRYPTISSHGTITAHLLFFFLYCVGGVRMSLLGMQATTGHIVSALDDWWVWSSWNENWQGKLKYSEKTSPSAILSITDPTWPEVGSNTCSNIGKPLTNRLRYGMASYSLYMLDNRSLLYLGLSIFTPIPLSLVACKKILAVVLWHLYSLPKI
jgi:hypothetical protein